MALALSGPYASHRPSGGDAVPGEAEAGRADDLSGLPAQSGTAFLKLIDSSRPMIYLGAKRRLTVVSNGR